MSNSEESNGKKKWSFEQFLRKTFKSLLDPAAGFLLKIGLTPNMVTIFGVVLSIGVAALIAAGSIRWAGVLLLFSAPLDALDGSMARLRGLSTPFGAFLDSVTDRYSELIIHLGLLLYFLHQSNSMAVLLVFLSAAGSVLVSYVKARAESVGFNAKVGLLTRVERMIVLIACLLLNIPIAALWILAILGNFTAFQRIYFVYQQAFHSNS